MILSGLKIKEELKKNKIFIERYNESLMNPNSYNYTLGEYVKVYKNKGLIQRKKKKLK